MTTESMVLFIAFSASMLALIIAIRLFVAEIARRRKAERELHTIRETLALRIQEQIADFKQASDQRTATIASDNARLIEQTQQAQVIAEQGLIRLVQNQLTASALSEATSAAQVVEIAVKQGVSIVEAVAGALSVLDESGTRLNVIGASGYDPINLLRQWASMPLDASSIRAEVIRSGKPIWVGSQIEARAKYPDVFERDPDRHAWAVLPLFANGRVFGTLGLSFAKEQAFGEMDKAFIIALAYKCAQALERIRLSAEVRAQRERFRITLSSIGEAVIATDIDGHITFLNPAAESLTGWSADKAIGTHLDTVLVLVNENTGKLLENCFEAAITNVELGYPLDRLVLKRKDGSAVSIATSSAQIHNEKDDITGLVVVLRDVTVSRKQESEVQAALQRTQDLYQTCHRIALVNQPGDVLRAQFTSRYLNQGVQGAFITFERYWTDPLPASFEKTAILDADRPLPGLADSTANYTIAASPLLGLFSPDTAIFIDDVETDARVNDALRSVLQAGNVRSVILYPLGTRGTAANQIFGAMVAWFATPVTWLSIDRQHIDAVIEQVTVALENARLLAQEKQARAEAEEANTTRLKFLAMISHELRTPLTSIKGFASTLMASDVQWEPKQQAEFIAIIDEEANKLAGLIDQLLDMSRLQAGALVIHLEPRKLPDLLNTMKSTLEPITEEHTLVIDEADDLPFVQADPKRLSQIFVNLIGNAAKYSPPGTTIHVMFAEQQAYVQVNIADEGPGIPVEDRERIFAAFAQLDRTSSPSNKGVGLGLAIAKGMVEAHGGQIWVVEEDRKPGATFAFTLPIASPTASVYA